MDFDSSSKFISSLAKFLQSLCNGYVEFDNGVEVIGHIYLNVDTGKKIDYILNEKVCKTDQNSVTFISNSFHAQPAEKEKPPSPKSADKEKPLDPGDVQCDSDEIMILDDGETKTLTLDNDSGSHKASATHTSTKKHNHHKNSKRSYNQSFSNTQRHSDKHSRTDSQNFNGVMPESESIHSENYHSSSNRLDSQIQEQFNSNSSNLPSSVFLPLNSSNPVDSAGDDSKQETDNDISLLQVKEEYDPGLEEAQEAYEESQAHGAYGGEYDESFYSGFRRVHPQQIADFTHSGSLGKEDLFQGAGEMGDTSGDKRMWKRQETYEQAEKRKASQRDRTRRYRERIRHKLRLLQEGANEEIGLQSKDYQYMHAIQNLWPPEQTMDQPSTSSSNTKSRPGKQDRKYIRSLHLA